MQKNYLVPRARTSSANVISKRSKMLNMRKWKRVMGIFRARRFKYRHVLRRKKFKRMPKWKRRRIMKTIK